MGRRVHGEYIRYSQPERWSYLFKQHYSSSSQLLVTKPVPIRVPYVDLRNTPALESSPMMKCSLRKIIFHQNWILRQEFTLLENQATTWSLCMEVPKRRRVWKLS